MDICNLEDIKKRFIKMNAIAYLKSCNIKHLWVIWSYAKWDFGKSSDIDFVFEKKEKAKLWLFKLISIKNYLECLLWKKADLVSKSAINKHIKNQILLDKIDIF